jgi:hypothetical protein
VKHALRTSVGAAALLFILLVSTGHIHAESNPAKAEIFKVHLGWATDLMIHSSIEDGRVTAGGFLPLVDVGFGARLGEHVLIAGQASVAMSAWRVGMETRMSIRGWSRIGPVFWSGLHFVDMGVNCGDLECPDDEHFGLDVWSRGPMLSLGAGYQWPFADDIAFTVGVGTTVSHLTSYTPGGEEMSPEASHAVTGWYAGMTMLRFFVEY